MYQSAKSPNDLAHLLGASSLLQFRVDSLHNIPPNCSRLISFVSAAHCEVLSGGPQRCPIEAIRLILEEKLELGLQHKDFSSATDPLSNLWTPLPSQESLINALVKQGLTPLPDPFVQSQRHRHSCEVPQWTRCSRWVIGAASLLFGVTILLFEVWLCGTE